VFFGLSLLFAIASCGSDDASPASAPSSNVVVVASQGGFSGYLCVTESGLGAEGRDVRALPSGTTLEAGPFRCSSRRGPVLRCRNRSGHGFQLRPGVDTPDARTVF
jgi:hypothetical protein